MGDSFSDPFSIQPAFTPNASVIVTFQCNLRGGDIAPFLLGVAGLFFEDARKVEGRFEAELQGDLLDGQVGSGEQILGTADAQLQMVLPRGKPGVRLEGASELGVANVEICGNVLHADISFQMFGEREADALHELFII